MSHLRSFLDDSQPATTHAPLTRWPQAQAQKRDLQDLWGLRKAVDCRCAQEPPGIPAPQHHAQLRIMRENIQIQARSPIAHSRYSYGNEKIPVRALPQSLFLLRKSKQTL